TMRLNSSSLGDSLSSESGCLYRATSIAAAVPLSTLGDAVAESCAGDSASQPICAAGAIAGTRPAGQVEGPGFRHHQLGAFFALSGNAVGITKSTGLNFLNRSI